MTKREEREHLFKLLFCKDFHDMAELQEQVDLYQTQQELFNEEEFAPVRKKLDAVVKEEGSIDMILSDAASGWRLNRMGKAELTILRIAVYEIRYDEEVPDKVAINEAVELAKKYGSDASSGFVNGVLAKVVGKCNQKGSVSSPGDEVDF
ncbi:MAG: transcription antitermination factor NusB [Lachnospiraceae bacterium]|nr:transcription antitermination factor NusB [Lachnospiraceae bacterium]